MKKISTHIVLNSFSAAALGIALTIPFAPSWAALSERVIEHAGDWSDVLVNEKALCMTSEQGGLRIQVYPSPNRDSLYLKVFPQQSVGLDGIFQAGTFSISLNYLQSPTPAPVFGAIISADKMVEFVHAFTSSKTALVKIGDAENTISLAGTSPAVDGLNFYAHEHRLNLPLPFSDDADPEHKALALAAPVETLSDAPAPAPDSESSSNSSTAKCADDFHACKDNEELVNKYNKIYRGQAACKTKADGAAEYGSPQWPGFWSGGAFGSFRMGDDAPKTGLITLVEPNAQFQNGFGAMVHSTVTCVYDLNNDVVRDIQITAH
ncbi:hypothetical protein [Komagataeibacter oboediens]|uniref:hypothetical protein n=1 Tax=Komagataeibacter oboediens TaxID=65958 RepID=UPI0019086E1B|nr:hypothetical protein [Komagataeibacter oboediens]GCE79378.1 hypothetical protein MSKU3_0853 [Komagataeibacter oboediens]